MGKKASLTEGKRHVLKEKVADKQPSSAKVLETAIEDVFMVIGY